MASDPLHMPGRACGMPSLGFGTAPLAAANSDEATAALHRAHALGVRVFDTAPRYGAGRAEVQLGRALASLPRAEYLVSTKVGWLIRADGNDATAKEAVPAFSADAVRRSLEGSLERLGLDRVDIALLHDPEDHLEEAATQALPTLYDLKAQGIVGAVGVGTTRVRPLIEIIEVADLDVCLIAGRYSLLDQEAEAELLPLCASRGIHALTGGVFNSGILASDEADGPYDYALAPPRVRIKARRLSAFATEHEIPLPALALQYPARNPSVSCVLAGMKSVAEVETNVSLFHTQIDEALWREMDDSNLLRGL